MRPSPAPASCATPSLITLQLVSFIRDLLLSQRKSQEGSLPNFLPHSIAIRAGGSNSQLAVPVIFTASFSLVSVGDRNPAANRGPHFPRALPTLAQSPRMNGRAASMCIEGFFTMCEQILCKAAEQNSKVVCLQNISDHDRVPDATNGSLHKTRPAPSS